MQATALRTPFDQPDTLPKLLWNNALATPDRPAIREKHLGIWQEIRWADYLQHVEEFALGLVALGLSRGEPVAIQAENCQEWLYSDLAIQCAGGVVTTVYPTSSVEEVGHILRDSGARIVVVGDQEHLDKVLALHAQGLKIRRIILFDPRGVHERGDLVLSFKEVQGRGRAHAGLHPELFASLVHAGRADDACDIMYTSGTSGAPKGAVCTQRGPVEGGRRFVEQFPIHRSDSWLSYLPLSHAFERIMAISVHLLSGCLVNFADSLETVQEDMVEIQPTVFGAVPRILEKMKTGVDLRMGRSTRLKRRIHDWAVAWGRRRVQREAVRKESFTPALPDVAYGNGQVRPCGRSSTRADRLIHWVAHFLVLRHLRKHVGLLNARYVICGAAPMSEELFEYYMGLGVPIMNGLGMTELHNIPCMSLPNHTVLGTVGHPLPGWEVMKRPDGELLVRGPTGFLGYRGQSERSREMLDEAGWMHTGDLCEIYDNGYVAIIGRKKDVLVTSGGKNISPELIENKLKASPYISEAVVIGEGRHYLSCLIELDGDAVGDLLQMRGIAYATLRDMAAHPEVQALIGSEIEKANATLARVETIKKFRIIPRDLSHDDGEMTPTRKVKRSQMERQFADLIDAMYSDGGGR